MKKGKQALQERVSVLRDELVARPLRLWHEDIGPVLWWCWPIGEAPYAGSPLDNDWPGYHTHRTPIVIPLIAVNQRKPLSPPKRGKK
jgi:hypothetical protein